MLEVDVAFSLLTVVPAGYDIVIPLGGFVIPMGTIIERHRKDGTPTYTAQIILKRKGHPTYREAKTFTRRGAAVAFIKNREAAIKDAGSPEAALGERTTLKVAIGRYVKESLKEIGSTKAQVLEAICRDEIADRAAPDIGSSDIVAYAKRLSTGRKPQTVANYISHLSAVFAIAKPAWGIPLDYQAMKDAQKVLKRLGMIGKSDKRDERPTLEQLDKILNHYTSMAEVARRRGDSLPMHVIIPFAIFSTRRQDEITRIEWVDLDEVHSRVLVRDMKNPGDKIGNDTWVDLPPEAMAIIKAQARTSARIFPFNPKSISTSWTNTRKFLEIGDLHFHDLRHDGISRLFEIGWGADGKGTSIPHVAAVSGHRTWTSLKRYTHLRLAGDKYADWKWLKAITA